MTELSEYLVLAVLFGSLLVWAIVAIVSQDRDERLRERIYQSEISAINKRFIADLKAK